MAGRTAAKLNRAKPGWLRRNSALIPCCLQQGASLLVRPGCFPLQESTLKTLTNQKILENMVCTNMESFMKNRLKTLAASTFVSIFFVLLFGNAAFSFS